MLTLLLAACGSPAPKLPPGVPADAVVVSVARTDLTVAGAAVTPWKALGADPTSEFDDAVIAALRPLAGRPLLVRLPGETPFWTLRKIVGSARQAGAEQLWIARDEADEAFVLAPPPRYGIRATCDAPQPVTGAETLITLSVQTGADGAWTLATAQFLPVLEGRGPVDGLGPECLAVPACDALFPEGPAREACAVGAASGSPGRVTLGGEYGCLLPIARQPDEVGRWRQELPTVLGSLGMGERPLLLVMPEARSRLDAVLAVLGGFVDAGLPVPSIGFTLLIEGNDGPPVCNAPVRTREALGAAGARWLGAHHPAEAGDGR